MISEIKNVKIFDRRELSNDKYHGSFDFELDCGEKRNTSEYVSGSGLFEIIDECPAFYKYAEKEETKALSFGTASHTMILERDKFDAEYFQLPDKTDYPDDKILTSDTACRAVLKSLGVKGHSTKKGEELYSLIAECAPEYFILSDEIQKSRVENFGKTELPKADMTHITKMRDTLASCGYSFAGHQVELSVFCDALINGAWIKIKIRPDAIGDTLTDYKTTISSNPDKFSRQAFNAGYWLKMALQFDILNLTELKPSGNPILLAQSKKSPYIAQSYEMLDEQIEYGRNQYMRALIEYQYAIEHDEWGTYGPKVMSLPTPAWVKLD